MEAVSVVYEGEEVEVGFRKLNGMRQRGLTVYAVERNDKVLGYIWNRKRDPRTKTDAKTTVFVNGKFDSKMIAESKSGKKFSRQKSAQLIVVELAKFAYGRERMAV